MPKYESKIYPLDETSKFYDVPFKIATEENFKKFGRFVSDFDTEDVWIETWPQAGWRAIAPGTGNLGGVVEGDFSYRWTDRTLFCTNDAVHLDFTIAKLPPGGKEDDRTHAVAWEFNYHPDGGQVFFPKEKSPFVALLALPGDDVKPEDFIGFYFDGSCGVQLRANIWHQAMIPQADKAAFKNKQGAVYACVPMDMIEEHGTYLRVPMQKKFLVD